MKFFLTMNMPSNQGRAVHQIVGEAHNVDSLGAFWEYVTKHDFIIVDEFYYEKDPRSPEPGVYIPRGPIILNTNFIGKIRPVPTQS